MLCMCCQIDKVFELSITGHVIGCFQKVKCVPGVYNPYSVIYEYVLQQLLEVETFMFLKSQKKLHFCHYNLGSFTSMFKGITSRICQLLFVKATFKVGSSSLAHAPLVVPCAYDLVTGCYIFIEFYTSHAARCYCLGATHHCPKVGTQKRHTQAGSLQIQTLPHTSSGS